MNVIPKCNYYGPRSWSELQSTRWSLLPSHRPCVQAEGGWEKCYAGIIKHTQKVNVTRWEVNFQCTKFHLVPRRKDSCKEDSAIRSSSFIGEHSIIKALEWWARPASSQGITVYNSKSDGYYQSFKDPQKLLFYNLPWKQISVINTLFIKFFHMLKPVKVQSWGIFYCREDIHSFPYSSIYFPINK